MCQNGQFSQIRSHTYINYLQWIAPFGEYIVHKKSLLANYMRMFITKIASTLMGILCILHNCV